MLCSKSHHVVEIGLHKDRYPKTPTPCDKRNPRYSPYGRVGDVEGAREYTCASEPTSQLPPLYPILAWSDSPLNKPGLSSGLCTPRITSIPTTSFPITPIPSRPNSPIQSRSSSVIGSDEELLKGVDDDDDDDVSVPLLSPKEMEVITRKLFRDFRSKCSPFCEDSTVYSNKIWNNLKNVFGEQNLTKSISSNDIFVITPADVQDKSAIINDRIKLTDIFVNILIRNNVIPELGSEQNPQLQRNFDMLIATMKKIINTSISPAHSEDELEIDSHFKYEAVRSRHPSPSPPSPQLQLGEGGANAAAALKHAGALSPSSRIDGNKPPSPPPSPRSAARPLSSSPSPPSSSPQLGEDGVTAAALKDEGTLALPLVPARFKKINSGLGLDEDKDGVVHKSDKSKKGAVSNEILDIECDPGSELGLDEAQDGVTHKRDKSVRGTVNSFEREFNPNSGLGLDEDKDGVFHFIAGASGDILNPELDGSDSGDDDPEIMNTFQRPLVLSSSKEIADNSTSQTSFRSFSHSAPHLLGVHTDFVAFKQAKEVFDSKIETTYNSIEVLGKAISFEEDRLKQFEDAKMSEFHTSRLQARIHELKIIDQFLNYNHFHGIHDLAICISGKEKSVCQHSSKDKFESYVAKITIFDGKGKVLVDTNLLSSMKAICYIANKSGKTYSEDDLKAVVSGFSDDIMEFTRTDLDLQQRNPIKTMACYSSMVNNAARLQPPFQVNDQIAVVRNPHKYHGRPGVITEIYGGKDQSNDDHEDITKIKVRVNSLAMEEPKEESDREEIVSLYFSDIERIRTTDDKRKDHSFFSLVSPHLYYTQGFDISSREYRDYLRFLKELDDQMARLLGQATRPIFTGDEVKKNLNRSRALSV
tara:strand:- start:9986 stop:12598 length:2613 start_codon:yes stop_codon:yes gene_type:complete